MSLKKINDKPNGYIGKICRHSEHNPPMHIVLEPGTYEYICPGCGNKTVFDVPLITN
jgi:hypothetical protein